MNSVNNYKGINPVIARQVRYRAQQTAKCWPSTEREDVEQECMFATYKNLKNYDPKKGALSTFTDRISFNTACHITDKLCAKKRGLLKDLVPLEECADNESMDESCDIESQAYYDPTDDMCLALDLKRALSSLQKPLLDLVEQLKTQNISEISRSTGVPQSTLFDLLEELRGRFRKFGLHEYLN